MNNSIGAAAGPPNSYHLLPVGCHPHASGFSGVFVSDQHHLATPHHVSTAATGAHYALPLATADAPAQTATHQQQFIALGSPQFKVMAMGPAGQLIPTAANATPAATMTQFLNPGASSAFLTPGKTAGVRVTQTSQIKPVPLVQTAAGSDECVVQVSTNNNGNGAPEEKVVYSAL